MESESKVVSKETKIVTIKVFVNQNLQLVGKLGLEIMSVYISSYLVDS